MSDDSEATWSHVDAPLDDDEEGIVSDYSYDGGSMVESDDDETIVAPPPVVHVPAEPAPLDDDVDSDSSYDSMLDSDDDETIVVPSPAVYIPPDPPEEPAAAALDLAPLPARHDAPLLVSASGGVMPAPEPWRCAHVPHPRAPQRGLACCPQPPCLRTRPRRARRARKPRTPRGIGALGATRSLGAPCGLGAPRRLGVPCGLGL